MYQFHCTCYTKLSSFLLLPFLACPHSNSLKSTVRNSMVIFVALLSHYFFSSLCCCCCPVCVWWDADFWLSFVTLCDGDSSFLLLFVCGTSPNDDLWYQQALLSVFNPLCVLCVTKMRFFFGNKVDKTLTMDMVVLNKFHMWRRQRQKSHEDHFISLLVVSLAFCRKSNSYMCEPIHHSHHSLLTLSCAKKEREEISHLSPSSSSSSWEEGE